MALFDLRRFFLPLFAFIVFAFTPLYAPYSKNYIDNTLKDAVVTYAVLRSLNAGVSVVQKSSITLGVGLEGTIALGEALDPINDAIERFSDMVTLSIWVLGAQKVLYEISTTNLIYILIALLVLATFFLKHPLFRTLLLILIILRLFIPFSALSSHYFNETIFNPQMQKSMKILEQSKRSNIKLNTQKSNNLWESMKISLNNAQASSQDFLDAMQFYIENSSKIIAELITLSMLYFGKYLLNLLLLPLLFVYIMKALTRQKEITFS